MTDALTESRVRLDYHDQNESFAAHLPATGTIRKRCVAGTGPDDWYLVDLDEPIDYQHRTGPHFQFERLIVSQVLIRSRWLGEPIGPSASPSVFLLLVAEGQIVPDADVPIDDYIHVCWARCQVIDDA